MSEDRTYWHVPGAKSWHGETVVYPADQPEWAGVTVICGRHLHTERDTGLDRADRIPASAHLCGNCARIIAARTDVEA